ncbi:unnamed protein product [Auanema sp. JU1783]|nr:unnamed protein product [Auanema sp. JU1783]
MEPEGVSTKRSGTKPKILITPDLVNKEIVSLRAPIKQAQRFLQQKLLRKKKFLSQCNEKKEDPKAARKIEKIEEELNEIKGLKVDDVAKLALVNDEPKVKLLPGAKNANERVMYSLIFEKPILKCVEKYQATYSDWRSATPYFLQRLGVRNKNFKEKALKARLTDANAIPLGKRSVSGEETTDESDDEDDSNDEEGEESNEDEVATRNVVDDDDDIDDDEADNDDADDDDADDDDADDDDADDDDADGSEEEASNEDEDDEEPSDVEMGTDSEDDSEKTVERRNLLLGLAGVKENKERPKIAPRKKEIVETDEEDNEDEEEENGQSKSTAAQPKLLSEKKQEESKKATQKKKKKTEIDASIKQKTEVKVPKKQEAAALPESQVPEDAKKVSKKKKKKVGTLQSMLDVAQLRSSEEGVIQRIELSRGGEVSFKNTNKQKMNDEEKKEAPSAATCSNYDPFFQSCDTDSNEEGEQSADDDEDLPILNYPKGEKGSMRQNVGRNKAFNREEGKGSGRGGGRDFDRAGGRGSGRGGGRGSGRGGGRDFDRAGGRGSDRGGGRGSGRGGGRGSGRGGGRDFDRAGGRGSGRGGGMGSDRAGGRGFDNGSKNKSHSENRVQRTFAAEKPNPAKGPAGIPEELHPSWAAKRLKKEQLAAKPQGTRTVFGED